MRLIDIATSRRNIFYEYNWSILNPVFNQTLKPCSHYTILGDLGCDSPRLATDHFEDLSNDLAEAPRRFTGAKLDIEPASYPVNKERARANESRINKEVKRSSGNLTNE